MENIYPSTYSQAQLEFAELNDGKGCSIEDTAALLAVAWKLTDEVCERINAETATLQTPSMPYKAQAVLEHVIGFLKERV